MKFSAVVKWIFLILVTATIAAGAAFFYVWNQKDFLVEQQIHKQFAVLAPELRLVVGNTIVQDSQTIVLRDVEVRDRQTDLAILRLKQTEIEIDSQQLLEHKKVIINHVNLDSADVLLVRNETGRWNWQDYRFVASGEIRALPGITIHDLRIQLNLQHGGGIPPARLLLTSSQLRAVPGSSHSYAVDGQIDLPGSESLKLSGHWDLKSKEWRLGGNLRDVRADDQLMRIAQATNPQLQHQLNQLDGAMTELLPPPTVPSTRSTAALLIGNSPVAPRFLGVLDIDFHVQGSPDSPVPQFRLKVEIRDGRLTSPSVPLVLNDVNATLFRDNENLIFRLKNARDGVTSLKGSFEMTTSKEGSLPRGEFQIVKLPVSDELKPLFPLRAQRFFDHFEPSGHVSLNGSVTRLPNGRWQPQNVRAEIHNGAIRYHRFTYPVTGINGTITQVDDMPGVARTNSDVLMKVNTTGRAGDREFTTTGWLKNPGPGNEVQLFTAVEDVPIDDRFLAALDESGRKVLTSLNLSGTVSGSLKSYRPPGLDQRTHIDIDAHVSHAAMRFSKFRYDISDLSGRLTFDSRQKLWNFLALDGRHGDAKLHATGKYQGAPLPGVLDLTIETTKGALDSDLYNALPKDQRSLWSLLNPSGFIDLTTSVHWTATPNQPAIVRFPSARIYDAQIRPDPFPYEMAVASAELSYDPNDARYAGVQHCEIRSLKASHNGTIISASGWAEISPEREWQVHLNDLNTGFLAPDDDLRAALPDTWSETLSRVTHSGRVAIENSQLDFKGITVGEYETTAAWDMNLRFRDCQFNAGLDVEHVHGSVTATGHWDGHQLRNSGRIRLDSVEVLEMPLTNLQGPYTLNNEELVLGSREVFSAGNPTSIPRNTRLTGSAYGGTLLLDALVDMRPGRGYRLFTELDNALLESYAARHIKDESNLKGVVAAWLYLKGTGESPADAQGRGQLRISPAALYELPVVVQLFSALAKLKFNVQNRTAFDYALVTFDVHDEAFWFNPIDLVGESMSLRGRGSVGFGGDVLLDFYSRPPRPKGLAIPFISGLVTQWATVRVQGTTSRPQTDSYPTGQLDESMKQFLQGLNRSPGGPAPRLIVPNIFQLPLSPMAARPRQ